MVRILDLSKTTVNRIYDQVELESNLAKCTFCSAEMIERTNDNTLECLNCGAPFTMPVKSTVK